MQKPGRVEGVRDEPELETSVAQRVEERVRRVTHPPRGRPGLVLGLKEVVEFIVRGLDAELPEDLVDQRRILDLLDRAGREDPRAGTPRGSGPQRSHVVRRRFQFERRQAGLPAGFEQLVLEHEVVQRVTPVEEDGVEHRAKGRVPGP